MVDQEKVKEAIRMILEAIGEDPKREGLQGTPERIARMYEDIFAGINADPKQIIGRSFSEDHHEMILVKDIPFYSMCEHHLLPFVGKAHVAYIPRKKIVGLSKIARVVDLMSKKPQLQERLTTEIAEFLMSELNPLGVMCVIEAEHLCMSMRGVKKSGALTLTSAVRGLFRENAPTREEAFALIRKRNG